jgi:hypothetical protein
MYNFGSGDGQAADKNALLTTVTAKYASGFIKWRFRGCAPVCVCGLGGRRDNVSGGWKLRIACIAAVLGCLSRDQWTSGSVNSLPPTLDP